MHVSHNSMFLIISVDNNFFFLRLHFADIAYGLFIGNFFFALLWLIIGIRSCVIINHKTIDTCDQFYVIKMTQLCSTLLNSSIIQFIYYKSFKADGQLNKIEN